MTHGAVRAGRAAPSADPRIIDAYARELVGKAATSRVLALAADPSYDGPAVVSVNGNDVRVRGCLSSLAVREVLVDLPADAYAIVLTDRTADDLGDALVCRFRASASSRWTPGPPFRDCSAAATSMTGSAIPTRGCPASC